MGCCNVLSFFDLVPENCSPPVLKKVLSMNIRCKLATMGSKPSAIFDAITSHLKLFLVLLMHNERPDSYNFTILELRF